MNLAIDFGFAGLFAFLFKFDTEKLQELTENVEKKVERKKEQNEVVKGMRQREKKLASLEIEIQISDDGTTTRAPVGELQKGARQHMIVVAGPRKACRDALIGANLLKNEFALSNVLVVPYDTGAQSLDRPEGGFGDRPLYETQPYVGNPVGEGWDEYIKAEMGDAVAQSGEIAKEEGIAIVVTNLGSVIRRGVGKVPWRQTVEQLAGTEREQIDYLPEF